MSFAAESRVRRRWAALLGVVFLCFGLLVGPGAAHAEDNDNMRITRYGIQYVVGRDGGVDVREDLTINYSDDSHHGFERYLVTAQRHGADKHRVFPLSKLSVSSPTGAPSQVQTSVSGGSELIRVGDEDRHVSGTQRYVITYHQSNVVNKQSNGTTEFYPNVLGTQWRIPIDSVDVTVRGPAPVTKVKCSTGRGSGEQACAALPGAEAHFSARGANQLKDGMSIDAAMPTSAFTNTAPYLVDGPDPEALGAGGPLSQASRRDVTWAGAALGAVLPIIAALVLARRRRTTGQDEHFRGLPPGAFPPNGTTPEIERGPQRQVAVRFEPPQDASPGLVGTLVDKRADDRDVSGTVVDLAVRGYLTMEQLGDDDWLLTARPRPSGDTLLPYEADLLNALFAGREEVRLSDLRTTFSGHLAQAKSGMYREVVDRGWFAESPEASRSRGAWGVAPFAVLAVLAYVAAKVLHVTPVALCSGFVLAGAVVFFMARGAGTRTAAGSAVNDQARGFALYLRTAEAKQFRFEEAEQIFSRYMPYAVVLGLADHWAKVFGEVANAAQAQGYPMTMPIWYVPAGGGFTGGFGGIESIGSSLDSFAASASSAFSATTGSSGGSGFSGGGGFGGGGFGGGGGGGW